MPDTSNAKRSCGAQVIRTAMMEDGRAMQNTEGCLMASSGLVLVVSVRRVSEAPHGPARSVSGSTRGRRTVSSQEAVSHAYGG